MTQQSQSSTKELEVVNKNEQLIKSSIGIFEGTKDKCLGKLKQVKVVSGCSWKAQLGGSKS